MGKKITRVEPSENVDLHGEGILCKLLLFRHMPPFRSLLAVHGPRITADCFLQVLRVSTPDTLCARSAVLTRGAVFTLGLAMLTPVNAVLFTDYRGGTVVVTALRASVHTPRLLGATGGRTVMAVQATGIVHTAVHAMPSVDDAVMAACRLAVCVGRMEQGPGPGAAHLVVSSMYGARDGAAMVGGGVVAGLTVVRPFVVLAMVTACVD